jgi:hypothetical protein
MASVEGEIIIIAANALLGDTNPKKCISTPKIISVNYAWARLAEVLREE